MRPEAKRNIYLLLINSVLFVALYFAVASRFPYILILYFAAAVVFAFTYVIYNKGFSGRGVTPEMLPDTMSPEEKQKFIDDSRRRMQKSGWMLTILFPLLLALMLDMMGQFLLPMLKDFFL